MVRSKERKFGRPRTDKCESCRRRHIRCDFLEPVCTPCRKDSFVCDRVPANPQNLSGSRALTPTSNNASHPILAPRPPIVSISVNTSVWLSYLYATLSANGQSETPQNEWIGFRATSQSPGSLASSSLEALSCAFFGRSTQKNELMQQGGDLYTICLRRLNESLGGPTLDINGDTLLAVAILGYYEALLATARFAWSRHYLGLARMLEIAGPAACADPLVFNIFVNSRFMMILAALATCEDTCFSMPEWKTIPWQLVLQSKGGMDILLDCLADLAHARSQKLGAKSSTVLHDLHEWHSAWMPSIMAGFFESADRETHYPTLWPDPLVGTNLAKANCFCLYHGTMILAVQHAETMSDIEPSWDDICALSQRQHDSAVEICRTLEYHLASTSTLFGSLFILWPFRMAVKVLGQGSPEEMAWIRLQIRKHFTGQGVWEIQQEAFDGLQT